MALYATVDSLPLLTRWSANAALADIERETAEPADMARDIREGSLVARDIREGSLVDVS
jgi:hypothetical protein